MLAKSGSVPLTSTCFVANLISIDPRGPLAIIDPLPRWSLLVPRDHALCLNMSFPFPLVSAHRFNTLRNVELLVDHQLLPLLETR